MSISQMQPERLRLPKPEYFAAASADKASLRRAINIVQVRLPEIAMILAIDVHYTNKGSTAAGVAFDDWQSDGPAQTYVASLSSVVEYTPGEFYQRELPCILNLLDKSGLLPDVIVIDGYVFLDGTTKPGLGKYLYDALGQKVIVVGVAKTAFAGIGREFQVLRGKSMRPLYVTCAGMELAEAKAAVLSMHGSSRLPTLLKVADQLCRQKSV